MLGGSRGLQAVRNSLFLFGTKHWSLLIFIWIEVGAARLRRAVSRLIVVEPSFLHRSLVVSVGCTFTRSRRPVGNHRLDQNSQRSERRSEMAGYRRVSGEQWPAGTGAGLFAGRRGGAATGRETNLARIHLPGRTLLNPVARSSGRNFKKTFR